MKIIVITGPTCTGKTELSLSLAQKYNGEIINADSTQIFKGMDIATAKINDTKGIKHYLLNIKNIKENYSVADYQKDARNAIEAIKKKNKTVIFVGGTGLYIKAALYDYHFEEEIINNYEQINTTVLYNQLKKLDPNVDIHYNNRKRIIKALNYINNTHKLFSAKEKTQKLLYDTLFIGLTADRNILYNKINDRVDIMLKQGLEEEAQQIYNSNIRTKAVLTPIGIKEFFPYFQNKITLEEAKDIIKRNSRRYAKKQYTWFNNQMDIHWITTDYKNFNKTILQAEHYIDEHLE